MQPTEGSSPAPIAALVTALACCTLIFCRVRPPHDAVAGEPSAAEQSSARGEARTAQSHPDSSHAVSGPRGEPGWHPAAQPGGQPGQDGAADARLCSRWVAMNMRRLLSRPAGRRKPAAGARSAAGTVGDGLCLCGCLGCSLQPLMLWASSMPGRCPAHAEADRTLRRSLPLHPAGGHGHHDSVTHAGLTIHKPAKWHVYTGQAFAGLMWCAGWWGGMMLAARSLARRC